MKNMHWTRPQQLNWQRAAGMSNEVLQNGHEIRQAKNINAKAGSRQQAVRVAGNEKCHQRNTKRSIKWASEQSVN